MTMFFWMFGCWGEYFMIFPDSGSDSIGRSPHKNGRVEPTGEVCRPQQPREAEMIGCFGAHRVQAKRPSEALSSPVDSAWDVGVFFFCLFWVIYFDMFQFCYWNWTWIPKSSHFVCFCWGFRHFPPDCMEGSRHRFATLSPCEILTNGAAAWVSPREGGRTRPWQLLVMCAIFVQNNSGSQWLVVVLYWSLLCKFFEGPIYLFQKDLVFFCVFFANPKRHRSFTAFCILPSTILQRCQCFPKNQFHCFSQDKNRQSYNFSKGYPWITHVQANRQICLGGALLWQGVYSWILNPLFLYYSCYILLSTAHLESLECQGSPWRER